MPRQLIRLLGDADPARARRAFEAMMQMKRIDIAALERRRRRRLIGAVKELDPMADRPPTTYQEQPFGQVPSYRDDTVSLRRHQTASQNRRGVMPLRS